MYKITRTPDDKHAAVDVGGELLVVGFWARYDGRDLSPDAFVAYSKPRDQFWLVDNGCGMQMEQPKTKLAKDGLLQVAPLCDLVFVD